MEIRSILVDLNVDLFVPSVVAAAADLARKVGAELIGFAAAEPSASSVSIDGGAAIASWYAAERSAIEGALQEEEQRYRLQVPADVKSSWRAFIDNPTRGLIASARCADLIVTGSSLDGESQHRFGRADIGEVVLRAGRPVLQLKAGADRVPLAKILVAWKDTREARRAVSDALPLLKLADEVLVAGVDEGQYGTERASMSEVVAWMESHQVKARGDVLPMAGSVAETLANAAATFDASMVVSGGYGHSRFREWIFGGATQDLLANPTLNRFFSN